LIIVHLILQGLDTSGFKDLVQLPDIKPNAGATAAFINLNFA
jgi:hypothetical protein